MADQDLRVFLEDRHHGADAECSACTRFSAMKLLEPMPKSAAPPASKLRHVHVGAALQDLHVQAALGIKPLASA